MSKAATATKLKPTASHTAPAPASVIDAKAVDEMQNKGIMQTVNIKITSIDEAARTFTAVASDESIDRHGENIMLSGWQLDNYLKNPVGLWSHDYWQPAVFTTTEIGFSENGELVFKTKWPSIEELCSDPANPSEWALFVDSLYNSYKGGYLRAFSVGLIPKKWSDDWTTILQAELLEISAVTVPANPNALVLAANEGVITPKQAKIMSKKLEAQVKALTTITEKGENDDMSSELTAELKETNSKLDKLITVLSKQEDANDNVPADDVTPTDEPVVTDPTPDDDVTQTPNDDPNADPANEDEPTDKVPSDDLGTGTDDDDPEIDEENVSEEQAKQIANATKAAIDEELGRVN